MENHSSKQQSSLSESKSPLLLPSSDYLEKIDVPSASEANSDPSASSHSVIGYDYHVFLSFRGSDTRKGFVDHLYHRLKQVGPRFPPKPVFRDDKDLPFGEKIGENLISAIKRSKVSIPIISVNYATSEWCLRELIHIMKCKERGEQKVFPVLYGVKPSEVRDLKGAFGEAFKYHEKDLDEEVKQQGLVALKNAVDLRVFEANGPEAELINELVQIIIGEQQHTFLLPLHGNLVGKDHRVAEVMKLADADPSRTRIIGIYGIGGIGKTTMATKICNEISEKFECRSFLMDVRETINRKGMEHIQCLLISDITKSYGSRVHDSMRGIEMIQVNCKEKKVLILLDDVGHRDHIDKLIGGCNFKSGSRIIITCRDKAILKSEYEIYELKELNREDSMLLFRPYAFEAKQPPPELLMVSWDIVATIGGLPLALKIIGSFLKGKDQSIWEETREKLRKVPHMDIQQKLRISYDSLGYEEQQMFLDIACFFIGIDKRFAAYLWEDLQYSPDSGLERMIELSLMEIDDDNKLRMHDQLRDLGRAIACPAYKKPWKCSRLWDEKATTVQQSKEENRYIEALHLDKNGSIKFMERESFRRMPYLKFLHLSEVDFVGDFGDSLSELRWLEWDMCLDSFNATNVYLEKLLILDLSGGFVSENWEGWNSIKMERLKVLNLSHCCLRSTPNLFAFKNLEMLILKYCIELEEIDPSIRDVKCLVSLNLSGCRSLKKLPKQLGELEKLEELVLSHTPIELEEIFLSIGDVKRLVSLNLGGRPSLKKLPEQLGELEKLDELVIDFTSIKEIPSCIGSLKKLKRLSTGFGYGPSIVRIPSSIGKLGELLELNLSYTSIKELPESIGELNKLKILTIVESDIERLPSSIGKLQSLQELLASNCKLKGQILVDKGGLSSLKIIDLSYTNISGLPENLDQLSSLEHLDLLGCYELESLPKPPFSLSCLKLTCQSNELSSLSHLKHLQELSLDFCESLRSIPSLSHLERLQKLDLYHCDSLQSISSLSHLKHLKELILQHCMSLQSILELPSCIQKLYLYRCLELERLPNLSDLKFLSELGLIECNGLKQLDGLEALKSLRELHVSRDPYPYIIGDFDEEPDKLHAIEGLEILGSLEVVDISGRKHIQLLDLSKSEHLKRLIVKNCKSLVEIRCPSQLLEDFDRDGCESLKKLPDFLPQDGP